MVSCSSNLISVADNAYGFTSIIAGSKGDNRRRLNTQVTVAVEPPSPTDGSPKIGDFAERHQRSQQWTDGVADESRRDLHRNKTVPARRSRSSTDVADGPDAEHHHRRRRHSPAPGGAVDGEDQPRRGGSTKRGELLSPSSLEDPGEVKGRSQVK